MANAAMIDDDNVDALLPTVVVSLSDGVNDSACALMLPTIMMTMLCCYATGFFVETDIAITKVFGFCHRCCSASFVAFGAQATEIPSLHLMLYYLQYLLCVLDNFLLLVVVARRLNADVSVTVHAVR
jgi:hypothetical protein